MFASIHVHVEMHCITTSKYVSKNTQLWSAGATLIALPYDPQPYVPYIYIQMDLDIYSMPHDNVPNYLVSVIQTDMVDQITCGYRTLCISTLRVWH